MKRVSIKLVLFLLLGALVNAGVATAMVRLGPAASSMFVSRVEAILIMRTDGTWSDYEVAGLGVTRQGFTSNGCLPLTTRLSVGWPARSFVAEEHYDGGEWTGNPLVLPVGRREFPFDNEWRQESRCVRSFPASSSTPSSTPSFSGCYAQHHS